MYPIGTIVYRPYTPQTLGKIIGYAGTARHTGVIYRIQWKNEVTNEQGVKSLDNLIADHQKKIETLTVKRQEFLEYITHQEPPEVIPDDLTEKGVVFINGRWLLRT
jgi:hypothetical protein